MAGRMENLSGLFRQSRTRAIILVTGFLLVFAVVAGLLTFRSRLSPAPTGKTVIGGAPAGIQSIPGSLNPTEQYAKLQEQQNVEQAKQAMRTGGSAIPTVIRSELFSKGKPLSGPAGAKKGVPFTVLSRLQRDEGDLKSLWLQNLKDSNCSVAAVQAAVQQGAGIADLKAAGCTAKQLLAAGVNLTQLHAAGFSAKQLRAAGFNVGQLRAAGFSANDLKAAGASACEMKAAGFSAKELRDAGYGAGELKGAGFSDDAIRATDTLPPGITADMLRKAGCGKEALQRARAAGVTAGQIKRIVGCSDAQLQAAGYAVKASPAEWSDEALRKAGCGVAALRRARAAGISAARLKRVVGCTAAQFKAAGFTAKELKDAGFSAKELRDAGFSAKDLKDAGFSAKDLKDAGFSAQELKDAGFSAKALKNAGFSAKELKDAGFSAKDLKDAGFSASDLKNAGFSARDLKDAGFSAKQLKDAGFTPNELSNAGFSNDDLRNAGFSNAALQDAGLIAPPEPAAQQQSQLQQVLQQQAQQLDQQRYQQNLQRRESAMSSAAMQLTSGWRQVSTQSYQAGALANKENATGGGLAQPATQGTGQQQAPKPAIVRAGDIIFAVLDTAVNSDDKLSPILATVVSGKLKGARLIGAIQTTSDGEKVVLSFNRLSFKAFPSTISISAVAIDQNTARTAISSRTDSHFLLRYGSLFAAALLDGYGTAIQSQGTSAVVAGTTTTLTNPMKRKQKNNLAIAAGEVGKQWSQSARQTFNIPPTVYVYSGTGLGILFTADLTSPLG